MPLAPGSRLSSYEIISLLGSGGMGDVYKAKDLKLGRTVVVKVLPEELASDPGRLKRFEQEARAASALDHPNIVTIHDISEVNGVHFIVISTWRGERSASSGVRRSPESSTTASRSRVDWPVPTVEGSFIGI
jgi:serine/threonine protein kinase